MSVVKKLPLRAENTYFELRAGFINVLNHPNFFFNPNSGHALFASNSAPPFNNVQAAFGKFNQNSITTGRVIELSVRLAW